MAVPRRRGGRRPPPPKVFNAIKGKAAAEKASANRDAPKGEVGRTATECKTGIGTADFTDVG